MHYDIAVTGNDEAAFEVMALSAAFGQRTLAVLPDTRHSSWLLSHALRRLVSGLLVDHSGLRRNVFRRSATPRLLRKLVAQAIVAEMLEHSRRLESLGVDIMLGEARFVDDRNLLIERQVIGGPQAVSADQIVIGTGVYQTPMHRPVGRTQFCRLETLFRGTRTPGRASFIGGNDVAIGLAALVSLFGVKTTIQAEPDGTSMMTELATAAGAEFVDDTSAFGSLDVRLATSRSLSRIIDCRRTVGITEHLNLQSIAIEADERGQLWCGRSLETWCHGVFGVGSVVGFASDATTDAATQAERILHRVTGANQLKPHVISFAKPPLMAAS